MSKAVKKQSGSDKVRITVELTREQYAAFEKECRIYRMTPEEAAAVMILADLTADQDAWLCTLHIANQIKAGRVPEPWQSYLAEKGELKDAAA